MKKIFISITVILSIVFLCFSKQFSLTSDAHTHEFNSIYSVESTSFVPVELWNEYEEYGHLYQTWYGHDRMLMYQVCYCGQRGNYMYVDSDVYYCKTIRVR